MSEQAEICGKVGTVGYEQVHCTRLKGHGNLCAQLTPDGRYALDFVPAMTAPSPPAPQGEKLHFAYDEEDMQKLRQECLDMYQAGNYACKWTPEEAFEYAQKNHSSLIEWLFDNLSGTRDELSRERESRKQAEDKAFNAGIEAAAKVACAWCSGLGTSVESAVVFNEATLEYVHRLACRDQIFCRCQANRIRALSKPVQEPAEPESGK